MSSKPRQPGVGSAGHTPEVDRADLGEPVPQTLAEIAEPRPRAMTALTDDAELIAACRRGEARAMELLYHQYKRRVFGIIHRIVGPGDAEEVAQEVFVRIFRALGAFRGESALSTWIYRLTVNVFPDLVVGAAGVTVLVEVKSAGGKLRPEQVEFIDGWRAPVVVAYSLEEAIRGIEAAIARAA